MRTRRTAIESRSSTPAAKAVQSLFITSPKMPSRISRHSEPKQSPIKRKLLRSISNQSSNSSAQSIINVKQTPVSATYERAPRLLVIRGLTSKHWEGLSNGLYTLSNGPVEDHVRRLQTNEVHYLNGDEHDDASDSSHDARDDHDFTIKMPAKKTSSKKVSSNKRRRGGRWKPVVTKEVTQQEVQVISGNEPSKTSQVNDETMHDVSVEAPVATIEKDGDIDMFDAPSNHVTGPQEQDATEPDLIVNEDADPDEPEEVVEDILTDDDFPSPFASGQSTPAESDIEDEADRILKHRFRPLTQGDKFIKALTRISAAHRSTENLYLLAENVQHALKCWQDEYIVLDKRTAPHQNPPRKPVTGGRPTIDPATYDAQLQAEIWGYTYDAKKGPEHQDPFAQQIPRDSNAGRELRLRRSGKDVADPPTEDEAEDPSTENGKRKRKARTLYDGTTPQPGQPAAKRKRGLEATTEERAATPASVPAPAVVAPVPVDGEKPKRRRGKWGAEQIALEKAAKAAAAAAIQASFQQQDGIQQESDQPEATVGLPVHPRIQEMRNRSIEAHISQVDTEVSTRPETPAANRGQNRRGGRSGPPRGGRSARGGRGGGKGTNSVQASSLQEVRPTTPDAAPFNFEDNHTPPPPESTGREREGAPLPETPYQPAPNGSPAVFSNGQQHMSDPSPQQPPPGYYQPPPQDQSPQYVHPEYMPLHQPPPQQQYQQEQPMQAPQPVQGPPPMQGQSGPPQPQPQPIAPAPPPEQQIQQQQQQQQHIPPPYPPPQYGPPPPQQYYSYQVHPGQYPQQQQQQQQPPPWEVDPHYAQMQQIQQNHMQLHHQQHQQQQQMYAPPPHPPPPQHQYAPQPHNPFQPPPQQGPPIDRHYDHSRNSMPPHQYHSQPLRPEIPGPPPPPYDLHQQQFHAPPGYGPPPSQQYAPPQQYPSQHHPQSQPPPPYAQGHNPHQAPPQGPSQPPPQPVPSQNDQPDQPRPSPLSSNNPPLAPAPNFGVTPGGKTRKAPVKSEKRSKSMAAWWAKRRANGTASRGAMAAAVADPEGSLNPSRKRRSRDLAPAPPGGLQSYPNEGRMGDDALNPLVMGADGRPPAMGSGLPWLKGQAGPAAWSGGPTPPPAYRHPPPPEHMQRYTPSPAPSFGRQMNGNGHDGREYSQPLDPELFRDRMEEYRERARSEGEERYQRYGTPDSRHGNH